MKKYLVILIIIFIFIITSVLLFLNKNNADIALPLIKQNISLENRKNLINIVFTTDKKYKDYLKVAIKSAIINKNKDTFYNIYILCIDLPKKETDKFKELETDKVKINTIALKSKMLNKIKKHKAKYEYRVSRADLFKFFIPEMFKDFDKILYLDCDILVLKDLEQIYNLNIENKLIGVLYEKTDFEGEENSKFNCGVILFNIKNCIKNNLTHKLIMAKNNDSTARYVTQLAYTKALNVDDIYLFPVGYNYLLKEEKLQKEENPIIVHFAGFEKPWHNPDIKYAALWREYAKYINSDWRVEKRSIYFCTQHAFASVKKSENINILKYAKKLKNKYQVCRCTKKVNNIPSVQEVPKDFSIGETINLVFTTDINYKEYLKVALYSAIVNKKPQNYYNIYILCVDLSKKDMSEFTKFESNKVKINTIPLKLNMFNGAFKQKINLFYISEADLFKFFIPDIFKNLDKILYLDSDILVLKDLKELYNTNIENKYIAAVKRYNFKGKRKKDDYNCGVILFNLKKLRQDKIVQKLIEAKNEDKDGRSTQYSFNKVIPLNKIVLLSPIYNNNVSSINKNDFEKYNFKQNYAPFCDNMNTMDDLDNQTVIAHFIGYEKPWHKAQNMRFKKEWWDYAQKVNPDLKIQKRSVFERLKIAYIMTIRSSIQKTFFEYVRKFYIIFKNC